MTAPEDPPPSWAAAPPPSYGPPPGYGPPAGYPAPPGYGPSGGYGPQDTDSRAIVALVLAIVSFTVFPLVPAIISLVLASQSQREIAASGGRLGGSGLNLAARIISWINIGLCALAVVVVVVLVVAFAHSSTY